jgi:type II secretory pathway component GspD/PulD (secretin)
MLLISLIDRRDVVRRGAITLFCLCMLALFPGYGTALKTAPSAEKKDAAEAMIDLQFPNMPLDKAMRMFADASGKTIILGKETSGRQNVNAFYNNVPFSEALRSFAEAQELCVVHQDNCILLVSRREYLASYAHTEIILLKLADPQAIADMMGGRSGGTTSRGSGTTGNFSTRSAGRGLLEITADTRLRGLILRGSPERIREVRKIVGQLDASLKREVFMIRYASVAVVADAIRASLGLSESLGKAGVGSVRRSSGSIVVDERSNRMIIHDTEENLELCRDIQKNLDIPVESRVFSTGKIKPEVIAEQISKGELASGGKDSSARRRFNTDTNVQVVEGSNQIIVTDTPERLEILGKVMDELNRNISTEIFRPLHAMPAEIQGILQSAFPESSISVDQRTNSIVITAHKDRLEQISDIIDELDSEANVEIDIEAKIMLVSRAKLKEYGMRIYGQDLGGFNETLGSFEFNPNFLADGVKSSGSSLGNPPNGSISNPLKTGGNYLESLQPNLQINALVRALESDDDTKILSNPKLRALAGKEASFFSGSREPYKETSLQESRSQENVEFLDIGVQFDVTPLVSPDKVMTLAVMTEFSVLREIRDGIPVVDKRFVKSTVESRSGETIFLGGLITSEEGKSRAGIPVLRSIPILGFFFGDKRARISERELVIVIVPRIVDKSQKINTLKEAIAGDYESVLKGFGDTDKEEEQEEK